MGRPKSGAVHIIRRCPTACDPVVVAGAETLPGALTLPLVGLSAVDPPVTMPACASREGGQLAAHMRIQVQILGEASSCRSHSTACAEARQTQLQLGCPDLCVHRLGCHPVGLDQPVHTPPSCGHTHTAPLRCLLPLRQALTLSLRQLPHLVVGSPVVAQLHAPCIDQHAGRFRVPVVQVHSSRDLGGLHQLACRGEQRPVQIHPRRDLWACSSWHAEVSTSQYRSSPTNNLVSQLACRSPA